ncbi:phage tail protein [Celerinatantimonas sp. MCCC 1A17872]|uniref:phage tail protein n=1 Tax=Celerinatantimonas sp. MCCC 1A17872 TaxID=3177514 RepID=UPI0038C9273D
MAGPSSTMAIDTAFLNAFEHLPNELAKAVRRSAQLTNRWLRAITMAELGVELQISSKAINTRFRSYGRGGQSTKLWIGIRDVGVHRLGRPVQTAHGVEVGNHFFPGAFINPMQSSDLLVWRRRSKVRTDIEMVRLDISDEAQAIVAAYLPQVNRKFRELFHREFRHVLSLTQ